MSRNKMQLYNSFKKNTAITYTFVVPMLITMAILMTIFASWKNEYLIMLIFMIALWTSSIMAYRQRKLEYWTFERRTILFLFGSFPVGLIPLTFIEFGLLLSPHVGLTMSLVLATYISISNLVIFMLVYKMKLPTTKHLTEVVAREAKRSNFFMYGFLGVPLLVLFAVFVGIQFALTILT